jgi:hypothetical protein
MNYPIYNYKFILLNNIKDDCVNIDKMKTCDFYKIIFSKDVDYDSINELEKLITIHIIYQNFIDNDKFMNYMKDKIPEYKKNFNELINCDMKNKYLKYKMKYLKSKGYIINN